MNTFIQFVTGSIVAIVTMFGINMLLTATPELIEHDDYTAVRYPSTTLMPGTSSTLAVICHHDTQQLAITMQPATNEPVQFRWNNGAPSVPAFDNDGIMVVNEFTAGPHIITMLAQEIQLDTRDINGVQRVFNVDDSVAKLTTVLKKCSYH